MEKHLRYLNSLHTDMWKVCRDGYAHVDKAALLPLDVTTTEGGQIVTNDQIAVLVKDHPERFIWICEC